MARAAGLLQNGSCKTTLINCLTRASVLLNCARCAPALAADDLVTLPHAEARGHVGGEVAVPLLVPAW